MKARLGKLEKPIIRPILIFRFRKEMLTFGTIISRLDEKPKRLVRSRLNIWVANNNYKTYLN